MPFCNLYRHTNIFSYFPHFLWTKNAICFSWNCLFWSDISILGRRGGGGHILWLKKIYRPCVIFKVLGPPWTCESTLFMTPFRDHNALQVSTERSCRISFKSTNAFVCIQDTKVYDPILKAVWDSVYCTNTTNSSCHAPQRVSNEEKWVWCHASHQVLKRFLSN